MCTDPEEFLQSLLSDTLRAEPLIHLSTGQEAFMYQLVVEKDERLALPTVQQLFDQSFLSSSLKFKEVPPCLIIQMPRCGPSFKMYARIQPSMALDVTDALLDAPRSCHVCGALAEVECVDCYDVQEGLESTAYCRPCLNKVHSHRKRVDHESRVLIVSQEARDYFVPSRVRGYANGCVAPPTPPRVLMELFAVVCIQTSHYVAFVKAGSGAEAPWCFFDSMADRSECSEDNGYNIPEVVGCPGLHRWLSEERIHEILSVKDEKLLPEHARRLLCDAYLCFYQSHDTLMYR
ncbi:unnamed protein product [Notodromas monacha]|uniref:USP domain-containing protein n=1 Tax=Notodromas monacha TaxID=399045 RepID=A0A7R9GF95_9CRUS|nr:unnamed protein product [Notodromas monacha]CAG0920562.1 unnamed protein product [Notodromas monacha]